MSTKEQEAADRVIAMAEEVEASGDVSVGGAPLEAARAALHKWIDNMTGVVAMPALGRVTIIHPNGRISTISSSDLPFIVNTAMPTSEGR
jgi:hypothetical protein